MTYTMPGITPLVISLLAAAWLGVCAYFDTRTRHVPNWLTLPAIPLAILAAWLTRESCGETMYEFVFHLVIMTLPLFVAWRYRLLGGADLKILVVLSLVNPLLVLAAWAGVVVYFIGLRLVKRARPVRFAGVPGFALGAGLLSVSQVAISVIQNLVA
ncbi:MAG: A24 family peptidase [Anaerolineales bacterium]|jgi:Flp pilus assembly protein protease CpaA|nr:A24 family peptidase [Anaerolineales bacterium]